MESTRTLWVQLREESGLSWKAWTVYELGVRCVAHHTTQAGLEAMCRAGGYLIYGQDKDPREKTVPLLKRKRKAIPLDEL